MTIIKVLDKKIDRAVELSCTMPAIGLPFPRTWRFFEKHTSS